MTACIDVGEEAPDFILPDMDRKPVSLIEFRGKNVVLAFYPGAFTSICKKEMCTFRDSIAMMESLNAQVLGISVNDPFSNKAFHEINMLNFPLLCDFNREVVSMYGVSLEDFAGLKGYTVAQRAIFIIDKRGIIRYKWIADNPSIEPNYDEINEILTSLE